MEQFSAISSILLWPLVLLNLLFTFALIRTYNKLATTQTTINGLKEGEDAPSFTAHTLGGETVTLSSYTGSTVAFLFISPTCQPCREALPHYESLRPKAAQVGVTLVLVSVGEVALTQALTKEFLISLPILLAPRTTNPFMKDYKVDGTPSYCLVNATGKVQSAGYTNSKEWEMIVESWEANESLIGLTPQAVK